MNIFKILQPKKLRSYKLKSCKGQILIELILAVSLAAIIISSIIGLFIDISQASLVSLEQTQAEEYVQEAIESLYSICERSWNDLVNQSYPAYPVNNNGVWTLSVGQESIGDNYSRQITMEPVFRNPLTGEIAPSGVEDSSTKKFIITISWQKPRILSITKEIYLTRYLGNVNWLETSKQDFDDGTTNNVRVMNNQGGELELDFGEGQGEHTGNKFSVFETSFTDNLDDANKKVSYRFTAQHSKTVKAIRIYVNNTHPNQSPKYRYGLQADSNGSPSGTWLGEDNKGYRDFETNESDWHKLDLEKKVPLTQGQVYHLVIEYKEHQINPAKYINLRALNPLNKIVPYNAADDPNLMIRWSNDNGLSWADVNKTPVYVLDYEEYSEDLPDDYEEDPNNPKNSGNPYHEAYDGSIWGKYYKGEEFIYSEATEFVSRVGAYVYLKKNNPNQPQDDLYIAIYDKTANETLVDKLFVNRNDVSTDYQLKEASFDPPLAMINGHKYQLYFYSKGTAENRAYQIGVAKSKDGKPYIKINYFGEKAVFIESNNFGGDWHHAKDRDTMFRFSTVADTGYFASGEYVSSSFDAGTIVAFNRINWTESIIAGITNVELQIATNTDNATWNFVGPDGTNATRFTNPEGEAIPLACALARYIRYKVYLTTTDNSKTPILYNVSVNYSP